MFDRLLSVLIVVLVLLSVSACSTVEDYQKKDNYNEKTEDFVLRMKWSDFIGASMHFQEDLREEFLDRFDDWETLKVSEIRMSRTKSELDGAIERKIAIYYMEYYLLTEMKVHKEKIKIIWELAPLEEDKGSYWRIVEPFPELEVEKK